MKSSKSLRFVPIGLTFVWLGLLLALLLLPAPTSVALAASDALSAGCTLGRSSAPPNPMAFVLFVLTLRLLRLRRRTPSSHTV